jgi:hypothetical protein
MASRIPFSMGEDCVFRANRDIAGLAQNYATLLVLHRFSLQNLECPDPNPLKSLSPLAKP